MGQSRPIHIHLHLLAESCAHRHPCPCLPAARTCVRVCQHLYLALTLGYVQSDLLTWLLKGHADQAGYGVCLTVVCLAVLRLFGRVARRSGAVCLPLLRCYYGLGNGVACESDPV